MINVMRSDMRDDVPEGLRMALSKGISEGFVGWSGFGPLGMQSKDVC